MSPYVAFFAGVIFVAVLVWVNRWEEAWLLRRFRNIIFYGPYPCEACHQMIVRSARAQGSKAYDYPAALPYPNTEWQRHECSSKANEMPDLYLYRQQLQAMEDACSHSQKHTPQHAHDDSCFRTKQPPNCSDSAMPNRGMDNHGFQIR